MLGQCLDSPPGSPGPAPTSCMLPKLNRRLPRYEYRNNLSSFIWINRSWLGAVYSDEIHLFGCMCSQTGFIFQIPDLVPKETTHKRCHLRTVPITAGSAITASQQQLIRSQMKITVTNPSTIALTEFVAPHTSSQTRREQIYHLSHLSADNFL